MKTIQPCTFDSSAKTITFTGLATVDIARISLITNVTDNIIIYQFNNPLKGGTVSGNVLTLTYDTTGMSDTDNLQVIYEVDDYNSGVDTTGTRRPLLIDVAGRTKISHGQPDAITGTIDAVNSQVAVLSDGFSDAIFYFSPTGSHVISFEQSPNSTNGTDGTWFTALAQNQGSVTASAVSTGTITTAASSWRVNAPAGTWIRARVSTQTTAGTITYFATTTTASAQPQISATVGSTVTTSTYLSPSTTTGGVTSRYFAAALTAKAAVKTAAGSVTYVNIYNPGTSGCFLQWFNTALASVTVGTTAPVESYWIPAGGGYTEPFDTYDRFTTAITIAPWSVADN